MSAQNKLEILRAVESCGLPVRLALARKDGPATAAANGATRHREARLAKRRPAKDGEAPPGPLAAEKSDPV